VSNDQPHGRRGQVDEDFIRRAASWLRDNPGRSVGLASDQDAYALATLLEVLAAELPHLDADVRRKTVDSCRQLLGELAEERLTDQPG
jgi:hypothetical protein